MLKDVQIGRQTSTIIVGAVTAVNADSISVSAPVRARKLEDGSWKDSETRIISKTDANGNPIGDYVVGQPFIGFIAPNDDESMYVADSVIASAKITQFTNKVKNLQNNATTNHNDALIVGTLTKATQVIVNTDKKCVSIPFNQPDGEPSAFIIWKDNPKSSYGPRWADYTDKDGKTHSGLETMANRLKERLGRLKEDEVLFVTYCGRFEHGVKQADNTWKNEPLPLTEKDGKQMYTLFATTESSLGDVQRYAFAVNKAYEIKHTFEKKQSEPRNFDHSYAGNAVSQTTGTPVQAPAVESVPIAEEVSEADMEMIEDMLAQQTM